MVFHFTKEHHPGRLKILFIANAFSSHTHAWIDLLADQGVNVRLFSLPGTIPPADWQVDTYIPTRHWGRFNLHNRRVLYTFPNFLKKYRLTRMGVDLIERMVNEYNFPQRWLSRIIMRWKPNVIHTLGLDPAGFFFLDVMDRFSPDFGGKWVVTVRGGPDLALNRFLPEFAEKIKKVFAGCDQVIADNEQNYQIALEMGLDEGKVCPHGALPGTGGIEVEDSVQGSLAPPSQRERIILWPKGYENIQSKALPVFEALRIAWPAIQPCKIFITAVIQDEVRIWFEQLPEEIKSHCVLLGRIPRQELLRMMTTARVVLAPSVSDGVPNLLFEAMATGAFPVFSPLGTILHVIEPEENALFARNLYPHEIAHALTRAMGEDALIDEVSRKNLDYVRRNSNRNFLREKIVDTYLKLGGASK